MSESPRSARLLSSPLPERRRPDRFAAPGRIAAAYLVFGLLWVWLSEGWFAAIEWPGVGDSRGAIGRGAAFVLVSAGLFYAAVRREARNGARTANLLQAVADGTTDAVFVKDGAGRYLFFNAAAAGLVGRPAPEVVGRDDTFLFDPDGARRVMGRDRRIMAAGRAETEEEELTAAGVTRTYLATKAPYRDEVGRVIGVIGISRDITDRKAAERDLAEACDRLEEAQGIARMGSWVWNESAGLARWSRQCYALFGLDPAAGPPTAAQFLTMIHPDDLPVAEARSAALRAGADRFEGDFRVVRPDGRVVWIHSRARVVRGRDGRAIRVEGIDQDVTDRKRIEEELRAERDRFEKIVEAVPVAICSFLLRTDGTACFPYACRKIEDIYGLRPEELAADAARIFERYHPDDVAPVTAAIAESARTMTLWRGEFRVRHPSRGEIWVEGRSAPVRQPDGSTLWHGFVADVTERKRIEEALRESEEQFRATFEQAAVGVAHATPDGRFLWVNERYAAITGYTRDELLGRTFVSITHPDDRAGDAEEVRRLIAGETSSYSPQKRFVRKDGTTVWVQLNVSARRAADGRPVHLIGIAQDITDRKRADAAVRASEDEARRGEALLSAVMDSLPVSVIIADAGGRLVRMNPASGKIWGPAPMSGGVDEYRDYAGYWPDTGRRIEPHEWPMARAVLRGETTTAVRVVIERFGDGARRHLELSAAPVVGDGGARLGGVVACQDVTERVAAEVALREGEWRFRNVFENAATGIGITDAAGRFLQCNPAYCAVLGRTEDELRAADLAALIHPDDRAENMALLRGLAAGAITGYEVENRFLHKSGEAVWVHKLVSALRDETGRTTHLMALVTDVTERRRAECALRESEARQAYLLKLRSGFRTVKRVWFRGDFWRGDACGVCWRRVRRRRGRAWPGSARPCTRGRG